MGVGSVPVRVWSVGHGNQRIEDLSGLLGENGIRTVVDVRSAPYSRYCPQFNREALGDALASAGLAYAFAGDYLGGRPKDPICYRCGERPAGHVDYLKEVDYDEVALRPWYRRGLDRLLDLAAESATAVLCSEEDPARCHRHHLIARTLVATGVEVLHLRADGRVLPAPLIHTLVERNLPLQVNFLA